jgi:hypothetical protein
MFDFDSVELGPPVYAALAAVTVIPSFLFVAFVGKAADSSRDTISDEQKATFKKRMMDTNRGIVNLGVPSSEEEVLQKAIAKAYMQDKDVDVAVLEQKLRQRQEWRKEMMAAQLKENETLEDEDGW